MVSRQQTSRTITNRLSKLESSLKKKLLAFYNAKIRGSIFPIDSLKRQYDNQIRNIIRKAAQDSYLVGTDTVGQQVQEKNPDFELFISATDVNNIQSFTNNMAEQFWATSGKLLLRENESVQINGEVKSKPDLSREAAMIGLSSLIAFGAFNNAIKSKLPIATAAPRITQQTQDLTLQFDVPFEIKELRGRVVFTTQRDAKVDPEICGPLDGNVYDANDPDLPVPPLHRFCRCHLVPEITT